MALVVGLGNPGEAYVGTRHNAGFWVLDRLRGRMKADAGGRRPEYQSWATTFRGHEVTLLQPLTFMNLSGEAVVAWRDAHGLELGEMIVVADDVYLPVGHLRLRASGSSGGHRGLESIEESMGSREFARLRIGVGAADSGGLRDHVLETPVGEERALLERAVIEAAEGIECWIESGSSVAMNRINRRVSKEVSEP